MNVHLLCGFMQAAVRHQDEPLVKRLARLEQLKYKLVANAFLLESRVVRFSVMNYRVRTKVSCGCAKSGCVLGGAEREPLRLVVESAIHAKA